MRITLERSNLLKSLNHVHRVVERRNTIPILSNVLLRASGADLELKATDLDLEITEAVAAMVEQPGATTVPAHLLYEIVRKLPEGSEVRLATNPDGGSMTVQSGRSKFSLQCLPEADFPDLTAGTFSHTFKLKATDLKMLIDRTQFAISTEETRYYLNGIFFHTIEAGGDLKLRAVATDGHRLARADSAVQVRPVMAGRLREESRAMFDRPALRIGRAIIDPAETGMGDSAGTHGARLQRYPQVAILQPVAQQFAGGGADDAHFGMGGWIMQPAGRIRGGGDNLPVQRDCGPDRHLSGQRRLLSRLKRGNHGEWQGKHRRGLCPLRAVQATMPATHRA